MDALNKAFTDSERSYFSAKQSVADISSDLLSRASTGGLDVERRDFSHAAEQLRHFRGWVYASIRPIAQKIAGQPIQVGKLRSTPKRRKQPDAEPFTTHPILDMLADPNDLMVSWSLLFCTVASLELTGIQLWWLPTMDGRRRIFPIPTSWIEGTQGTVKFLRWLIRPPGHAGDPIPIDAKEAVYFSYPNPADPKGAWSPLQATAAAVAADDSITQSQRAMFGRGIHPSHAVVIGKDASGMRPTLSGAQERQLIRAIRDRYSGTSRHGDPLILDGIIEDIKTLSNTPAEMDWLSSGKATKGRITQIFGSSPIVMGELEGANRASALAAEIHFAEFTVNPKIELISQCLTEWLRPMYGDDRLRVWIEPVVPHDAEMELKRMQILAQNGAITVNELRDWAGLPAVDFGGVPSGDGDKFADLFGRLVDERLGRLGADAAFNEPSKNNGRFSMAT